MDYHIKVLPDNNYEVEFHGETKIVPESWLVPRIKPKKFEELKEKQSASVRDNWDFAGLEFIPREEPEDKIDTQPKSTKITRIGEYTVEPSRHQGLYELWKYTDGWHFVAYFFNVDAAKILIEEDRNWEKYIKKLKRSIHEYDLPKPQKDPNGEDYI